MCWLWSSPDPRAAAGAVWRIGDKSGKRYSFSNAPCYAPQGPNTFLGIVSPPNSSFHVLPPPTGG